MRKGLFKIYNLIAAYPVLALLCIAIGLLVYIGGQYKPVEQSFAREQAALMQLKQKAKELEKDLVELHRERNIYKPGCVAITDSFV